MTIARHWSGGVIEPRVASGYRSVTVQWLLLHIPEPCCRVRRRDIGQRLARHRASLDQFVRPCQLAARRPSSEDTACGAHRFHSFDCILAQRAAYGQSPAIRLALKQGWEGMRRGLQ